MTNDAVTSTLSALTLEQKASLLSGFDFWTTKPAHGEGAEVPAMTLTDGPHGVRLADMDAGFYSVDYQLTNLKEVAAKTKHMPDEFINAQGNNVTEAFKYYLTPLLGSNMPSASMLRAPKAEKILHRD